MTTPVVVVTDFTSRSGPASQLRLVDSVTTTTGVVIATYEPAER